MRRFTSVLPAAMLGAVLFVPSVQAGALRLRVPEAVAVPVALGRLTAPLTPAELLPILSSALDAQTPLAASDIRLPASLILPRPLPELRVLRVKPDPALNANIVRLGPLSGTPFVPFDVIVRSPRAVLTTRLPTADSSSASPRPQKSVVEPARLAALSITSSQSRFLLHVRPLERGVVGQVIRVRLPGSAKTFRATVVAKDSLEALM